MHPFSVQEVIKDGKLSSFSRARRYVLKQKGASIHSDTPGSSLLLSQEDERILRTGLGRFDMDFRVRPSFFRLVRPPRESAHAAPCQGSAELSCLRPPSPPAFILQQQWMGNLADSVANASARERVVRLYRSWTGHLIYEARYRPTLDDGITFALHEFAYEGDINVYNGGQGMEAELETYAGILGAVLREIKEQNERAITSSSSSSGTKQGTF